MRFTRTFHYLVGLFIGVSGVWRAYAMSDVTQGVLGGAVLGALLIELLTDAMDAMRASR